MGTSHPVLRIIDANLDRIGEGLRLLEDVARFLLNDSTLSQQLKNMRHDLLRGDWPFHQRLIQSRNSQRDVGVNIEAPGEERQRELPVAVMANARRVQESLRVLEELAKVPDIGLELNTERFKQARFSLYTIEQELLSKLQRRDKTKRISGLYVVVDTTALRGRHPAEVARQAIRGGARTIQLYDKASDKRGLLATARQLRELCAEHGVLFIVNEHLDLMLASDADGLHLGQNDLPVKIARQLLPIDKILGCSVDSVDEAVAAESEGADYIVVSTAAGWEQLSKIRETVSCPLVATGNITPDNAAGVIAAGADSIAISGTALEAADMEVQDIVERLDILK